MKAAPTDFGTVNGRETEAEAALLEEAVGETDRLVKVGWK